MLVTMSAEGLYFLKTMTLCQSFPCCDDLRRSNFREEGLVPGVQFIVAGKLYKHECEAALYSHTAYVVGKQKAINSGIQLDFFFLFNPRVWQGLAFTANWTQPRSPEKTGSVRDCVHQVSL